jgi:hypothetical protein
MLWLFCRLLGWNWQPSLPYAIYSVWQAILEAVRAPQCPYCLHRAARRRSIARHIEAAHGAAE